MPTSLPAAKDSERNTRRAKAALTRKRTLTALEAKLLEDGGHRAVKLVQWARNERDLFDSDLAGWRANRDRYTEEAQDVFDKRAAERASESDAKPVFGLANDSLNVVAALAEFASAQAEQDLFGGDPWFAAKPVGLADDKLAESIQRHRQWSLRDGVTVATYCEAISAATTLGEAFLKSSYRVVTEDYERPVVTLTVDGRIYTDPDSGGPVKVESGKEEELTRKLQADFSAKGIKGKAQWTEGYETSTITTFRGVDTRVVPYADVSFRRDAPSLELAHTNVYVLVEMTAHQAMKRFGLSIEDTVRLALAAKKDPHRESRMAVEDAIDANPVSDPEPMGFDVYQEHLNTRLQLVEGYVRGEIGDGQERSMIIVFPPAAEDWIVWADYLANHSPNAVLPISCHPWEKVRGRLYGRGFFEKYKAAQAYIDNLWNQVGFRNSMHANPITGWDRTALDEDEDEADVELVPGLGLNLKTNRTIREAIQFAELPDLDNRSMELLNLCVQMLQMRSGITSASQGDMSALPENNTATGVRQLMSRAAVLLKKPVRGLRRTLGAHFAYETKLLYANFDRDEAFVWGEGEHAELITLSADRIRDLDIDVAIVLTQEQNQAKLESAQVASQLFSQWVTTPEIDKAGARILFLQAFKALEFDQSEAILRKPVVTLQDVIPLLPPEEQQQLAALIAGQPAVLPPSQPDTQPAATTPQAA